MASSDPNTPLTTEVWPELVGASSYVPRMPEEDFDSAAPSRPAATFIDSILAKSQQTGPQVIATGLADLDGLLAGGLRLHQLTLVGGEPGVGTSTLAFTFARHAAVAQNVPVLYVVPDGARQLLTERMASAEGRVPLQTIQSRMVDRTDRERLETKRDVFRKMPLWTATGLTTSASPLEISSYIEKHAPRLGPCLVVVDGAEFNGPRVADMVRALKLASRRLEISVVLVATTLPMHHWHTDTDEVGGLRELANVADELDLALLVDRPDLRDAPTIRPGEADLHVVKHRYGPNRTIAVAFRGHYATFVDFAPHADLPAIRQQGDQ